MYQRLKFLRFSAALALSGWLGASCAGVILNGTRVIVNEAAGEATVQLRNTGDYPVLVQAWVDDGDFGASPQQAKSPFTLMPPVARIDSQKGQAIRLIRMGDVPDRKRESVFWLNVVEIPPKPTESLAAGDNLLLLAFRTRVKVFYRPAALAGGVEKAHEKLCFSYDAAAQKLLVSNPSPFHLTFHTLVLRRPDGRVIGELAAKQDRMVAPGGERSFELRMTGRPQAAMDVRYSVINDYGGETAAERDSRPSCAAPR